MNNVIIPTFNEAEHSYYHPERGYYTPVSTFVSSFHDEFDKNYWSDYKAIERVLVERYGVNYWLDYKKKVGYENVINSFKQTLNNSILNPVFIQYKEDILKEWAEENKSSIEKGNRTHKIKEGEVEEEVSVSQPLTSSKNPELEFMLPSELPDGVYTERRVWSNDYMVCGTIDKLIIETVGTIRYADVHDYKSNKELKRESFKHKKMKAPFNDLDDCNFNHYQVQLNTYQWLLKSWGFVPRNTTIEHTTTNSILRVALFVNKIDNAVKQFKNK